MCPRYSFCVFSSAVEHQTIDPLSLIISHRYSDANYRSKYVKCAKGTVFKCVLLQQLRNAIGHKMLVPMKEKMCSNGFQMRSDWTPRSM